MKVYIAGKITGDPEYRNKFGKAASWLRARGHAALNPATLPDWRESEGARVEMAYCKKIGKAVMEE